MYAERIFLSILILAASSISICAQTSIETRLNVNCAKEVGKLKHFWATTGGVGSSLDIDERQQLLYLSSIPNEGTEYIRTLGLLSAIKVKDFETESPQYDWSRFDDTLDFLVKNSLKPFLNINGVPEGLGKPGEDKSIKSLSPDVWRRLSRDIALHCIERYGRDDVRSWYFESWNEPDGYGEDLWNYYDACSEGLKEADEQIKFGGPDTFRTLHQTFTDFLAHCDTGKNYVTGEKGVRLDFISVHEKGVKRSGVVTDANPVVKEWTDREVAIMEYIRSNHPRFAKTLYVNDECDPKGGYFQPYLWQAGPYYPAIVCKYVDFHLRRIINGLGADTLITVYDAFIGGWEKRTKTVKFADERGSDLIKKPIYNGMVMLSLLGDKQCAVQSPNLFTDAGAIATKRDNGQVAVLVYNCNEVGTRERHDDAIWVLEKYGTARVKLQLEGLPFKEAMLVHYRIDKDHANPYEVWKGIGSPAQPTAEQLAKMRAVQELAALDKPRDVKMSEGKLALDFELPMPGISLILLNPKPANAPGKVTGLRTERYVGMEGREEVMLLWKDIGSNMLLTYEALYSDSPTGPFRRINDGDLLCMAFLHVKDDAGSKGYYKVRAVDYWGRAGDDSEVISGG